MNGWKKEGLDDPEDRDVDLADRVFWVPKEARWKNLQDNANLKGMLAARQLRARHTR